MNTKFFVALLCLTVAARAETDADRLAREANARPTPVPQGTAAPAAGTTSLSDALSEAPPATTPLNPPSTQAASNGKSSPGTVLPSSPLGDAASPGTPALNTSAADGLPAPSALPEPTFERVGPARLVGPCKADGWVPVAMEGVAFRSSATTTLYNGKAYSVKTPPFLLVPKDNAVTIDPRVLPVVNHLIQEERRILTMLRSELAASQPVASVEQAQ